MEETAYDIRQADTLAAWQQALAEVPQTPALSSVLLQRKDDLFGRFAAWYGGRGASGGAGSASLA